MIEITDVGMASTFQDLGRPGQAHLGIGRSGALDRRAHRMANRLVGNTEEATTIETCGGLSIRVVDPVTICIAGAQGVVEVRHGPPMAVNTLTHLPAGAEVTLRAPQIGMRYYLAVRGGFDIEPVLGSRSFDTLAGIGPRLRVGAVQVVADPQTPLATELGVRRIDTDVIDITEGPRRDWFTSTAWADLVGQSWVVSAELNRVGVRLTGPVLERSRGDELPSEGLVEGALQVPHGGQPIVMLADHPVTGGYPVIAVVAPEFISALAQVRPGMSLRFRHKTG